ncbi:MAG: hypothetical protein Kow0029_26990 [Candidatus Rifleibacteriota bacterium]
MNRTIEITAKSEEEARQIAQGELDENELILDSQVITAPAKGIFGFVGKQEFKIRFILGQKVKASTEKTAIEAEELVEKIAEKKPDVKPEKTERTERAARSDKHERSDRRQARRRQEEPIPERPKEPVSEEIKGHEFYSRIFELIREVAANVGVDELKLEDYFRDGAWVIEASGENVSQLIGKRGRTLDALQYLMNIILNRGNEERIKLVLDAQGYREKRFKNLLSLAHRMSKKAVNSRRPVELEPMSTLDRRTVHMALKDKHGIETYSKGSEPMRRVVISPVKKSRNELNSGWQPVITEGDSNQEREKPEASGAVPMFMEEDV